MNERMRRSAIEALVGRFRSLPASWLSTAFFWFRTLLMIVRLMLSRDSSPPAAERAAAGAAVRAGLVEGLPDRRLGLPVLQQDQEHALGLREDAHQRVEDLRGDGVELQRARQVAGDLQDRPELRPRGTARSDARSVREASSVRMVESSSRPPGRPMVRSGAGGGTAVVEDHLHVADVDPVPLLQPVSCSGGWRAR